MIKQQECPRCRQPATATASRRGRCTACGASLVVARTPAESGPPDHLYGRGAATATVRHSPDLSAAGAP
jgi:hypothetical protein